MSSRFERLGARKVFEGTIVDVCEGRFRHREDLEPRVTVDSIQEAGLEGYRFSLDDRPVAELRFTAEGSDDDTGWFLRSIDAQAFKASPDTPLAWLGDRESVDVAGVDALLQLGREQRREALLAEARQVAPRTRASALTAARAQLLAGLASELAKGVRPFDAAGMAGPQRPTEQPS
jgi:hypothetical protein